jgi:hypothetical protein
MIGSWLTNVGTRMLVLGEAQSIYIERSLCISMAINHRTCAALLPAYQSNTVRLGRSEEECSGRSIKRRY